MTKNVITQILQSLYNFISNLVEDDLTEEDLKDPAKPPERRKVEMQILHMSDQSQQLVIQMLKELHGSQYKMRDASAYVDAGQRYFVTIISISINGLLTVDLTADV